MQGPVAISEFEDDGAKLQAKWALDVRGNSGLYLDANANHPPKPAEGVNYLELTWMVHKWKWASAFTKTVQHFGCQL